MVLRAGGGDGTAANGQGRLGSRVGSFLRAAKSVVWKGAGDFMQVPWNPMNRGLILLVDLTPDTGSTVLAFLSLGFRAVVVAHRHEGEDARKFAENFPDAILLENVLKCQRADFDDFLERRTIVAVVIASVGACSPRSPPAIWPRSLRTP